MEHMVTHAKIVPYNQESACSVYYQFNLEGLHQFDAMRVILEQSLYWYYLRDVTRSSTMIEAFRRNLSMYFHSLPSDISATNGGIRDLYLLGYTAIRNLLEVDLGCRAVRYIDCYAIFSQPRMKEYCDREYLPTITMTFLKEWFIMYNKFSIVDYFREEYPEKKMMEAALYLPTPTVIKNYDVRKSESENTDYQITICLEERPMTCFYLDSEFDDIHNDHFGTIYRWLSHFDLSNISVDDLVGILANFSIEHDQYVMNLNDPDIPTTIMDLSYDLVTGSSFAHDSAGTSQRVVSDHAIFIELIKFLLKRGQLKPLQDYELFGALLEKAGIDPKIVNYFVQPDTRILGEEAYAFRTSIYATFIKERWIPGMEAAGDEPEEPEEPEATPDETEAGTEETEEPTDDMGADISAPADEPDETPAEKKPEIDPDRMLLELAAPNETMADYIYREMVNRRITSILQNPPESARPNDLLMLKRWKSRWLYLTSIACLRDFLSRVSIRLTETVS